MLEKINPYKYLELDKGRSVLYNYLAALYRAVLDYFFEGFSYHAAAISFYTLMSFFPLLIFITVVVSYFATINTQAIVETLQKLFPQITQEFLNLLVTLTEKRTFFGIGSLIISFYFASSIFTSLHSAFIHVFENREESIKKKALVYLLGVPIFTLILLGIYFIGLLISFLINLIKEFTVWQMLYKILSGIHLEFLLDIFGNVGLIVQLISFVFIMFILYKYLAPHTIYNWKTVFNVGFFIAILLFLISLVFNKYIIIASKANPIYGALSGIFAFLAWLYLSFGIILIGARMLYYLEQVQSEP
ncbi:YhjD/YihY/BrkB family envelope integrity protein [Persephonella sp.]|uniref:YihY/virulence factor BrkB family protein n=1 Tax=Persephonella sp. TaxID=2060922 RepID=UPI002604DF40|nr:YhjD/YihY/BrkB family envelope integrity protein [Persephonella sp.]